jgi:hypothetical protein
VIDGLDCPAARDCVAAVVEVDDTTGTPAGALGFRRWNGSTWSSMPTDGLLAASISALDCVAAAFCMAVGERAGEPYAIELAGGRWGAAAPAADPGGDLLSVDCATADDCHAVGFDSRGTLAEDWNGTAWTRLQTPAAGSAGAALTGVSCAKADGCVAVGNTPAGRGNEPLVEALRGTAWEQLATPHLRVTLASPGGSLDSVSCEAAPACLAIGSSGNDLLSERSATPTWQIVATPPLGHPGAVAAISLSCPEPNWCMSGGALQSGSGYPFFVEWNGRAWTAVAAAGGVAAGAGIVSVSCSSPSFCLAAGSQGTGVASPGEALTEMWNGTSWASVPAP